MTPEKQEKFTMIGLEVAFLVAVAAASLTIAPVDSKTFLPLLALGAFRFGRAVSFNGVFKWLRDMLCVEEAPDSSGAGNSNNPGGTGWKRALSELVCCPICSGTWGAVGLYVVYSIHPQIGTGYATVLAAAGVAELLHWVSEYYGWGGRKFREESGALNQRTVSSRTFSFGGTPMTGDPETFRRIMGG